MRSPAALSSDSDFLVKPDPPVRGQDVEVTYIGAETTVFYQVDGGKCQRVTLPKNKRFKVDKRWLSNGKFLFLTTKKGHPGFLMREIHAR